MKGDVVAGSLIQRTSDQGRYFLTEDRRGELFIYRNGFFTRIEKHITKKNIETFMTENMEIVVNNGQQDYNYLVSIIFLDGVRVLLECDSEAHRKLLIKLF